MFLLSVLHCALFRKWFLCQYVKPFSSIRFTVSGSRLRALIHLELRILWSVSIFIPLHAAIQFDQHLLLKILSGFHCEFLASLLKKLRCPLINWLMHLFYVNTILFFIIIARKYNLRSGMVIYSVFVSFRIVYLSLFLLCVSIWSWKLFFQVAWRIVLDVWRGLLWFYRLLLRRCPFLLCLIWSMSISILYIFWNLLQLIRILKFLLTSLLFGWLVLPHEKWGSLLWKILYHWFFFLFHLSFKYKKTTSFYILIFLSCKVT